MKPVRRATAARMPSSQTFEKTKPAQKRYEQGHTRESEPETQALGAVE